MKSILHIYRVMENTPQSVILHDENGTCMAYTDLQNIQEIQYQKN